VANRELKEGKKDSTAPSLVREETWGGGWEGQYTKPVPKSTSPPSPGLEISNKDQGGREGQEGEEDLELGSQKSRDRKKMQLPEERGTNRLKGALQRDRTPSSRGKKRSPDVRRSKVLVITRRFLQRILGERRGT